jgi:hypothetical protein
MTDNTLKDVEYMSKEELEISHRRLEVLNKKLKTNHDNMFRLLDDYATYLKEIETQLLSVCASINEALNSHKVLDNVPRPDKEDG